MKLKVLLINPWIYDFAAVNLWSKPLGLLKVAEYLSRFDTKLEFIDCTEHYRRTKPFGKGNYPKELVSKPECIRSIPRKFGRYGMSLEEFQKSLGEKSPFDLVFMTSIMSYWYPGVQKAVEIIRAEHKNIPIILGGIYATLWHKHASDTSGADYIYKGPISENILFALYTFGFRTRKNREDIIPFYRLGLSNQLPFTPLLTGTGCAYRCSYCASGLLNNKFIQTDVGTILKEILELYDTGLRDFAFYDDALLVNAETHIKPLLKEIIKHNLDIRFHCPNGLHARFIDDELASLMKASGFRTLRLSLETINRNRQQQTGGKVTSEHLSHAVNALRRYGFTKKDIGVYLMYGMPGQSLEEVEDGVKFLKDLSVRIHLTEFSPIPGTECWDDLIRKNIIHNDIDPLLTNNTVFTSLFGNYDINAVRKLKLDVKQYNES
jgi:radical SAM superfamily enzyme YgiQ (UPF0313 family)